MTGHLTQQEFEGLSAALGQLVAVEAVLTRPGPEHRAIGGDELARLLSTRDPELGARVDALWSAMARVREWLGPPPEGDVPIRLGSGGNLL